MRFVEASALTDENAKNVPPLSLRHLPSLTKPEQLAEDTALRRLHEKGRSRTDLDQAAPFELGVVEGAVSMTEELDLSSRRAGPTCRSKSR